MKILSPNVSMWTQYTKLLYSSPKTVDTNFSMSLYIVTRYMGAAIKALDFGFEDVISQVGGSCIC